MKSLGISCLLGLLASLCVAVGAAPAQADTITRPLQRETYIGTCRTAGFIKYERRNVSRTPTVNDTSSWFWVGTTRSSIGHLETREYVRNSFTRYDQYLICKKTRTQTVGKKYRVISPLKYVYKSRYVNFACDPHCVPLFTRTTGWQSGYAMRGADGKVVGYK